MDHKIRLTGLTLIEKQNVVHVLKQKYRWQPLVNHPSQLTVGEWMTWRSNGVLYAYYAPLETETSITAEDVELLSSVTV